jgi:beta-lactamase superfamily II metal-dependent hydrolase
MNRIIIISVFMLWGAGHVFSQKGSDFILWQLPSQINTIGNSYVFQMNNGKVAVMDGGVKDETNYLRGFLAALGNEVDAWFVSHPHDDHIGALNQILKEPKGIKIKTIFHSEFPNEFIEKNEPEFIATTEEFYSNLKKSGIEVVNVNQPGMIVTIDKTNFRILSVTNQDITENPYNNSCMSIRVWDLAKSILFLGDLGPEGGDRLLNGPYRKDLDCDYLQMAHHGQRGVRKEFYRSIKFKTCLWPTPSWLYNNDNGNGYNTGSWETMDIRNLMNELGIKKHYLSFEGLCKIEY